MKYLKTFFLITIFSLLYVQNCYAQKKPQPFGFVIGETKYMEALNNINSMKWIFHEYEKKQFKEIKKNSLMRGKNTFLQVIPRDMSGIKNILLFFNDDSVLDALIMLLEPDIFAAAIDVLDKKYQIVKKDLLGESLSSNYPNALWQQNEVYIEIQKPGPYRLRLLYAKKLYYENYKDFLLEKYDLYRLKKERYNWMDDL
jgi:hypothetical protein